MEKTFREQEWLRQVAEGDEAAFKALFDAYWDHIYTVAICLTRSVQLSEDMVQEIFLKIWLRREQLTAVKQFEDYLFIVARNHIYNALKKEHLEHRLRQPVLDWFEGQRESPEQQLLLKESSQLIHQAISRLSPQQQTIYRMTREEGLTHEQVANLLNISPNTVRNHIVNSLKIMREYLKEHASPLILVLSLLKML